MFHIHKFYCSNVLLPSLMKACVHDYPKGNKFSRKYFLLSTPCDPICAFPVYRAVNTIYNRKLYKKKIKYIYKKNLDLLATARNESVYFN